MTDLSEQHIATIKDAAKKLTGAKRRAFQAQVARDYMNSKPYLAEKTFGWDRKTVALGLNELRTGLVCFDNFKARGNKGLINQKNGLFHDTPGALGISGVQTKYRFQNW